MNKVDGKRERPMTKDIARALREKSEKRNALPRVIAGISSGEESFRQTPERRLDKSDANDDSKLLSQKTV